jgi:predicted adenine nucleotide alpha hydrolase (AANH) superfamily ATPase
MKIFLHVCCGPCTIYPLSLLRGEGAEVTGYFYNPNIHPFKEFRRRLSTLELYAGDNKLPLFIEKKYQLTEFIRKIAFHESERCNICYLMRLEKTAIIAKEQGFDAFSTTLLYSKYQRHNTLVSYCEKLAVQYDIDFIYRDFRDGWQYGIDKSKELDLYRQPYCGCIYSEQERYDKSLRKK